MSGRYSIHDTGATYSQGKSIASLESDAISAGDDLVSKLGSVSLGSDHGASSLQSDIESFQVDAKSASSSTANAVSKLGENTAKGAKTAEDTNNEGTHAANRNTQLARSVNGSMTGPRAQ